MDNKGIAKSLIVIIIAVILIVVAIVYFAFFNSSEKVVYFIGESNLDSDNTLIDNFSKLSKLVREKKIDETISNATTYEKVNITEYFNEEYFSTKKLAVLVLYEDTSKGYMYSIDDIIYNDDRTEATIKYTYKNDGYAGRLTTSWYDYLFAEVDSTVENVNFVIDNGSEEE